MIPRYKGFKDSTYCQHRAERDHLGQDRICSDDGTMVKKDKNI